MTGEYFSRRGWPAAQGESNRVARSRLTLFCILMAMLYGLGIFWGLPSALSPVSDSYAPLGPLNWIARYRDTTVSYIYPPVHQLVWLAAYAPILALWKALGLIGAISKEYPYGFRYPALVFSSLLIATNLIAVGMAIAILVLMRRFQLTPRTNSWYSMCLLGLSGIFAYYSRVGNFDVPYLFWVVLSFVFVWQYIFGEPEVRWIVLSGAAGALAIGTKDQAIGVQLGLGLTLLLVSPCKFSNNIRLRIRAAFIYGCALLATYGVTSIAVNPWRWWAHAVFVTSDHVRPEYPLTLGGEANVVIRSVARMSHILSYGGILLGLLGLFILWRSGVRRKVAVLLIAPLTYFVSIIMKVRSTEERYLIPIAFVLALCAGAAVGEILYRARSNRVLHSAVLVALVAILVDQVVQGFVPVTYCQLFDTKHDLRKDLSKFVPEGSSLVIIKMVTFNVPDSDVYERYSLSLPPGKTLVPPTTHGQHLLKPYDDGYRYVLAGNTLTDEPWPDTGRLVHAWTYPRWIRERVYVPCLYEFFLYERAHQ